MNLSNYIERLGEGIAYFFMPFVMCYHLLSGSIFLNTAATDAQGLERIANEALIPFHYLFAGQLAIPHGNEESFHYEIKQHFDYTDHLFIKTTGSIVAIPFSLVVGGTLKGIAYLFSDGKTRHSLIAKSLSGNWIQSHQDLYHSLGMDRQEPEKLISLQLDRKEGDENVLKWEKEALKEVIALLKQHEILFWADCGTCLGAYRYGGAIPWDEDLDIAVLEPDFSNVRNALSHLNPDHYLVEDWSNRHHPETYLKVYVKKSRTYIDIYHFAINPDQSTIHYILSNAESMFMPTSWKIREKRYTVNTPIELVFPLKTADFDGIEIPVPNQTKKYLQLRYGENLDPAKIYNRKTGRYEKDLSHPYWKDLYVH